jgi:cytidylate kinase
MLSRQSKPEAAEKDLAKCRAYMVHQAMDRERPATPGRLPSGGPAVTIAYQTGAGARDIARRLAPLLQASEPEDSVPWTVFDRQLVERVLQEHNLPARLAKFMPEDRRLYIEDVLDELAGLHPPSWVLVPKVIESMLHLAHAGHVILVGRGATAATARMPNVFHVHLVGSLARRIERTRELENLSRAEAAKFVAKSDRGRKRYLTAYFHTRPDDNLQYHLVINTDLVSPPDAAELIADGARRCFREARWTAPATPAQMAEPPRS